MENNKEKMRIVGGIYKGKKIDFIKNETTRPLRDFVKESLFNIILHSKRIKNDLRFSKVLDLYCGVGSFGIECISRGANELVFVDADKKANTTLEKNLKLIGNPRNYRTFNLSVERSIKLLQDEKFDIFFLDPPYKDNEFVKSLSLIKNFKIYNKNNLVILHREKNHLDLPGFIDVIFEKKYGRSKLMFGKIK